MSDLDQVCTDACLPSCRYCRPVDYDKLARQRDAEQRRLTGGPGRPAWWQGLGLDPAAIAGGGRVTRPKSVEY